MLCCYVGGKQALDYECCKGRCVCPICESAVYPSSSLDRSSGSDHSNCCSLSCKDAPPFLAQHLRMQSYTVERGDEWLFEGTHRHTLVLRQSQEWRAQSPSLSLCEISGSVGGAGPLWRGEQTEGGHGPTAESVLV